MVNRRLAPTGVPATAFALQAGLQLRGSGGTLLRVAGGDAAPRLGLAVGAPVAVLVSAESTAWFNLAGVSRLDLQAAVGGVNVPLRVDLPPATFDDPAHADPSAVVDAINDAVADAQLTGLLRASATTGLAIRAFGNAQLTATGPAAVQLGLAPRPRPGGRVGTGVG